jgi:hypothetical protein
VGEKFITRRGYKPIPTVEGARRIIDTPEPPEVPKQPVILKQERPAPVSPETSWPSFLKNRYATRHVFKERARVGRFSQERGFGLYACNNCRWFHEPAGLILRNNRLRKTCEDWGVAWNDLPCLIKNHSYGYFTPIKTGFEQEVKINHLGPDELLILSVRIQAQLHVKVTEILRKYHKGFPVRFHWNREVRSGVVRRAMKLHLKVEADDGNIYIINPGDLVDDPAFGDPKIRVR